MIGNFRIGIKFFWHPFFFFLSIIFFIGYTIWVYRRTIPPVSGLLRFILVFLRASAFILMFFVLFGTIIRITIIKKRKATVAILVDTSSSMRISEHGKTRAEIVRKLLKSPEIAALRNHYNLHTYFFSDTLSFLHKTIPDSISFNGIGTDIARAIETVSTKKRKNYLGAILIFSDGAVNQGEDPVKIAETQSCPIYGVTVGEMKQKPDVVLTELLTNEITYTGNRVPVQVAIRGSGFPGKKISLLLKLGKKIVDQRTVVIPPNGLETSAELYFTPQHAGFQKFTVEVPPLGGELTSENNYREFYVKVLKSKLKVFLFASVPSADFVFLKRIIKDDKNINLVTRTQKKGDTFYEGLFPSDSEVKSVDLIILLDFPDSFTPLKVWNKVVKILRDGHKPFFLIAGKHLDLQRFRPIKSLLPFYAAQRTAEHFIYPNLTSIGAIHPVLRVRDEEKENIALWRQLPPLFSPWRSIRIRKGAQLLARAVSRKFVGLSDRQGLPLLLAYHVGEAKILVLFGAGLYRWDLLMWGTGGTNEVFKTFIGNSVRWLVVRGENKILRLSTNKRVYSSGEKVYLSAQVYDEAYHPVEDARVTIKFTSSLNREYTLSLNNVGNGRYQKTFKVFESGNYKIIGEAFLHNRFLGKDETKIAVSSFNPEFLETKANPELLKDIAVATGAKSGPPDSLFSIVKAMHFPAQSVAFTKEVETYNLPLILVLIILLLSIEWFIRKRKGMV